MASDSALSGPSEKFVDAEDRGAWAWFVVGFLASVAMMPLAPSLLEEGLALHFAQRIVEGDLLYRDIVFFTGPLPFELLAALFRVFGDSIWVARIPIALLVGAASASTYTVARKGRAESLAHVAAACWATAPILLFPLLHIYFYTTIAAYLIPLTIYAVVRGLDSGRWAVGAGVLLACVCLCKQTLGAALIGTIGVACVVVPPAEHRLARIARLLAGGLSIGLTVAAVYAIRGDLGALWFGTVELPLSLGASFRAPHLNLWPPGELDPFIRKNSVVYLPYVHHLLAGIFYEPSRTIILTTQALYTLPYLSVVAIVIRRLLGPISPASIVHTAGTVALITNLFPRGDWGHLVFVLPAAGAQLVHAVSSSHPNLGAETASRRLVARTATLLLYTASVTFATWFYTISTPPRFGPRVPQRAVGWANRGEAVPRAIRYLRIHAFYREPIFVARQEPLIYFATDTTNATRYGGILVGYPPQEAEIISDLEDVRFIVMSDLDQPLYHYYSRELPNVFAFFERFFEIPLDYPVDNETWLFVAKRRPDRGRTAVDFVEAAAGGRSWIVERDGTVKQPAAEPPRLVTKQLRRPLALMLGPGGGGLDLETEIPADSTFQASVGLPFVTSVEDFYRHPLGARHIVSVARAGGSFEKILEFRVSDLPPKGLARWIDFDADLSKWAGEHVTVRLEVRPDEGKYLHRGEIEWWGSPRIAVKGGG